MTWCLRRALLGVMNACDSASLVLFEGFKSRALHSGDWVVLAGQV